MRGQLSDARAIGLLRMLLLVAVLVGNHLSSHPLVGTLYFNGVIAGAAVYSLAVLVSTWRHPERGILPGVRPAIDLLVISALAFCSGRGFADIRSAFVVAPMIAAIRLSPARTAAISVLITALYIFVALAHPVLTPLPVVEVLGHGLFVVWSGVAAVVMSTLRARRERRIIELSEGRGRLVAQTVDAEERVRKQLSNVLHDNVIQDLFAARQDLAEAQAGDHTALARVGHAVDLALCQLRSTIEDLDPYLLDHLDLPTALETIATRASRHAACQIELDLQTHTGGAHTELVASLARELLGNAAKHSAAARITLALRREHDVLVLEISDDGRGFTTERAHAALRSGHIGLAASRERVEAIGGAFSLDSVPDEGTRVRCLLPMATRAGTCSRSDDIDRTIVRTIGAMGRNSISPAAVADPV